MAAVALASSVLPVPLREDGAPPERGRTAGLGHHYLVLPGAVLALALPWLLQIDNVLWTALLAAQLLLCAIGIVGSYATGLRPLRMVFFTFLLSWLGVGPLYQLAHRRLAWSDSGLLQRTGAVTGALCLTLLFVLVASVAMWHASNRRSPVRDRTAAPATLEPRPWAPWAFLGMLALLAPYAIVANGGLGSLFASRGDRTADLSAAGVTIEQSGGAQLGVVVILPVALSVAVTHLFLLRIRAGRRPGSVLGVPLADALGLAGGFLGMVLFANPISNTRFITFAAFGSVALAVLAPRSPRAGRWLAAGLAVITLAVYPISDLLSPDSGPLTLGSALGVFAGDDFDGFQQIINAIDYAHDTGFSLGRYALSAVLFFVPRSVWSWKATPSAIDVAEHRGYWFTNLSMPVHAEAYLEFGIIGVLVFAALLGWVWARMDAAWLHRPGSRAAWLVPYLCMAELGFIRGPLGSLAPVWLPVVLLLALAVRQVPAHRDAPAPADQPTAALPPTGGAR